MPDSRFFESLGPLAIADVLDLSGSAPHGPARLSGTVSRVASLDDFNIADAVIFIDDERKIAAISGKRFGLCIAAEAAADAAASLMAGPVASARDARASFALIAAALHRLRDLDYSAKGDAHVSVGAIIHPSAVIGAGAEIAAGARIGAYAVVGPGVIIGKRTMISEGASLWCAIIGADCRVGPNSAIGGPGFGFAAGPKGLTRIPQLGRVVIEGDVEIGANVCVDRGALEDTVIGASTKIDNLCQIGHNVRLGRGCILAAQVGIAGSVSLGDRVQCGGKAGIADHLTIGDDARIAAKAGVTSDVPKGETWGGYPARPMKRWLREVAAAARAARGTKKASDNDD